MIIKLIFEGDDYVLALGSTHIFTDRETLAELRRVMLSPVNTFSTITETLEYWWQPEGKPIIALTWGERQIHVVLTDSNVEEIIELTSDEALDVIAEQWYEAAKN